MYMNVTQEAIEMFQKYPQAKKSEVGGGKSRALANPFYSWHVTASPMMGRKRSAF